MNDDNWPSVKYMYKSKSGFFEYHHIRHRLARIEDTTLFLKINISEFVHNSY